MDQIGVIAFMAAIFAGDETRSNDFDEFCVQRAFKMYDLVLAEANKRFGESKKIDEIS